MKQYYKLHAIREIAGEDESFIVIIIAAFLEEIPEAVGLIKEGLQEGNHNKVYQNAHKIKPTVQQFELPIYKELIILQDWGKFKQNTNVDAVFLKLENIINKVILEMKTNFNL